MRRTLLLLVVFAAVAVPADAGFPGRNGVIVFSSVRRDGALELYSMKADGSAQRQLTHQLPIGRSPAWSPDGKRLAFVVDLYFAGRPNELWTMDANGTGLRRVAAGIATGEEPDWSPDGRSLVYGCLRRRRAICVVDAAGGRPRQLTRPGRGWADLDASWSPDGSGVVFSRARGSFPNGSSSDDGSAKADLYVVDFRTRRLRRLTRTARSSEFKPAWSTRGVIAFEVHTRRGGISNLFLMNANGGGTRRNLTPGGRLNFDPDWSPDGQRLVFFTFEPGYAGGRLSIIGADGSGRTLLPIEGRDPAWSPDGATIAFTSLVGISAMRPDGSALKPLLRGGRDANPAVSADGRTLAFDSSRETGLGGAGLALMDVGGTNLRAVDSASGGRPSWSPDGRRLALQEADDGGIEIYDLRTGQTQRSLDNLTNADPREPAWSPDGRRVAFVVNLHQTGDPSWIGFWDVRTGRWRYIINRHEVRDVDPAWSPDGKMIAFTRYAIVGTYLDLEPKHVNRGIYVMKANGADLHRIVKRGFQPAWSPDGRRIAYVRGVGGDAEIFVAHADGTGQRRLTRHRGWDGEPDWQPRP